MERVLKLSFSSVRAPPTAANADTAARYTSGRSLLNDALSPTGRQILQDVLSDDDSNDDDNDSSDRSPAAQRQSLPQFYSQQQQPRSATASPSSHASSSPAAARHSLAALDAGSRLSMGSFSTHSDSLLNDDDCNAPSFVRIECNARPFCLKLAEQRGEMVVTGFVPDLRSGVQRGVVERSGLVLPGDVLVAVNDETDALTSSQATVNALMDAQLPAVLTFRRMLVVKARLGEYTSAEVERNLMLRGSALLASHSAAHAALLVRAMVDVLDAASATTPLAAFVVRVESMLARPRADPRSRDSQLARLQQLMHALERVVEMQHKTRVRKWTSDKSANLKRIDVMSRQRASIDQKLDTMRANPALLNPEEIAPWQAYVELRHLSQQLRDSVERAKREHYLPAHERYSLRIGNDGVYVGVGDVWVQSFHATFTLETRATAPHVVLHLSTPAATHGLKLRAKNFTLSTEGRLPSFHCDELNLEAHVLADVSLEHDAIDGWRVPLDALHVELQRLNYYERQASSTKRGQSHDTVMKMLINRLLPSIVRHAAQNLLCNELGPLLASRDAHVKLAGEIKIQGTKLTLYDAALYTDSSSSSAARNLKDRERAAAARELVGVSAETAATLDAVFRALTDAAAPAKKKTLAFAFSPLTAAEPKRLSIRSLQNFFEPFEVVPQHKALATELWSLAMALLCPSRVAPPSFTAIAERLDVLNEYPVDVSVTLRDLSVRLELCETAATYYAAQQRILRQAIDSVAVDVADLDAMRDGTFLERQLAALDAQYATINNVLAAITTNVDDCSAEFRGAMPAGFRSSAALEATNVACKGPCGGTFTIPLTDVAQLTRSSDVVGGRQTVAVASSKRTAATTALTHEDGALVFSKFFLPSASSAQGPHGHQRNSESARDDASSDKDADSDDGDQTADADATAMLPADRLQVRVKNSSARVLFELPVDRSLLDATTTFVPFAFALETSDDSDEPPCLRVETGAFAKCQYVAEQVAVSGSAWQFVARTKESAGRVLQAAAAAADSSDSDRSSDRSATTSGRTDSSAILDDDVRSVWIDYADSLFLRLQFRFVTSCQVTREHMVWTLERNATQEASKVAQLKHRVCLVPLLQEIGAAKKRTSSPDGAARWRELTARRDRRRSAADAEATKRRRDATVTDHATFFARTSFAESSTTTDDYDRTSESMRSTDDVDSLYDYGGNDDDTAAMRPSTLFNGIEAFEEENSGDEDDSDSDDDDDEANDDDEADVESYRTHTSAAAAAAPKRTSSNSSNSSNSNESETRSTNDDSDVSKSAPETAQTRWKQQFDREAHELAASSSASPNASGAAAATSTTTSTLHKQTSVFF